VIWWNVEGREMTGEDWSAGFVRSFGMLLPGNSLNELNDAGEPRVSDSVFILMNAHHEDLNCVMPPTFGARFWTPRALTSDMPGKARVSESHKFKIQARSLAVFVAKPKPAERPATAPAETAPAPAEQPEAVQPEPVPA
jgi:isoamylase